MNSSFCEEICDSLNEFFKSYPALSKSLCSVGIFDAVMNFSLEYLFLDSTDFVLQNETDKDILELKNDCQGNTEVGYYSDFAHTDFYYHNNRSNMTFYRQSAIMDKKGIFTAIFFSTSLYKTEHKFLSKISTREEFRHIFWHELGHFLDSFVKISESQEFSQLSSQHSLEELLKPAYLKSSKETFAELFSMALDFYQKSPLLFDELGNIVLSKYQEFESQNSNNKIDLTSKFLIDEKRKRY